MIRPLASICQRPLRPSHSGATEPSAGSDLGAGGVLEDEEGEPAEGEAVEVGVEQVGREPQPIEQGRRGRRVDHQAGRPRVGLLRLQAELDMRAKTQPLGTKNAGSTFRNPPGDHAARLIESCGLKGHAVGGARLDDGRHLLGVPCH